MAKSAIKIVSFIVILCLVFWCLQGIFKFKYLEGVESMEVFYEQPEDSIDVIALGSSHAFCDINTGTLYDEFGIASFDLAGGSQPLWNTYFYLQEALKTQHPKLIVLDVYSALSGSDTLSKHVDIIRNTFGMEYSKEKLKAVEASTEQTDFLDYVLEYPAYHSRYGNLSKEDFLNHKGIPDRDAWKGYRSLAMLDPIDFDRTVLETQETRELAEKTQFYLESIISLAKEKDIPLVLICAPYVISQEEQERANTISKIASENDIPFINFNFDIDDIGLDYSSWNSDLYDEGHLNSSGSIKFSTYLGKWMKDHYELPDRRGTAGYESWEIDAENIANKAQDFEIAKVKPLNEWLCKVLAEPRFTTVLVFNGDYNRTKNYAAVVEELSKANVDMAKVKGDAVLVIRKGECCFQSNAFDFKWIRDIAGRTLMVKREQGGPIQVKAGCDDYDLMSAGITALLIDEKTGQLVELAGWESVDLKSKVYLQKYDSDAYL